MIAAFSNQRTARVLALISTGRVMKLNSVVTAKRMMPKSMRCGNVSMRSMPPRMTHITQLDAKLTMGTRAERILSGA